MHEVCYGESERRVGVVRGMEGRGDRARKGCGRRKKGEGLEGLAIEGEGERAEGRKRREERSVAGAGVVDGAAHRGQRPAGIAPPVEHRTPDRLSLPGAFTAVVVQAVLVGTDPHLMAFPVGPARVLIAAGDPSARRDTAPPLDSYKQEIDFKQGWKEKVERQAQRNVERSRHPRPQPLTEQRRLGQGTLISIGVAVLAGELNFVGLDPFIHHGSPQNQHPLVAILRRPSSSSSRPTEVTPPKWGWTSR